MPAISTNLLSVAQFSKDNNVVFEFHPTVFYVKDRPTGRVVLQGQIKNGLYHFNNAAPNKPPVSTAFLSTSSSLHLWHSRLGHPMMRTVRSLYHLVWDSRDHIHSVHVICQQLRVVCKARDWLVFPLDLRQFFHSHEPQQH